MKALSDLASEQGSGAGRDRSGHLFAGRTRRRRRHARPCRRPNMDWLEGRLLLKASASLGQWGDLTPADWVNGNLGASKANYLEDMSIPYRMVMTGLSVGNHTITIEWDTTKSGKHALDYLTDYNEAWGGLFPGDGTRAPVLTANAPNPTSGVSGLNGSSMNFAIPIDPKVPPGQDQVSGTADDIPTSQILQGTHGNFTMYSGTITSVSSYSVSGSYSSDS